MRPLKKHPWWAYLTALCLVFSIFVISACNTSSGNDDDDDAAAAVDATAADGAPTEPTTVEVVTVYTTFPETTWTCSSGACQNNSDLAIANAGVQNLTGTWTGNQGTEFTVNQTGDQLATFSFKESSGALGRGSFVVDNGILSMSIRYRTDINGILPRGLYIFKITGLNASTMSLETLVEQNELPADEPIVAQFFCQAPPCNGSTIPNHLIDLTPAHVAGTWSVTLLGIPASFAFGEDGSFSYTSGGAGGAGGQGHGTFSLNHGVASATLGSNTVQLITDTGITTVALRPIEVAHDSMWLEVADTSVTTFSFVCGKVDSNNSNTPLCGRAGVDLNANALTTEDFVGKWFTTG